VDDACLIADAYAWIGDYTADPFGSVLDIGPLVVAADIKIAVAAGEHVHVPLCDGISLSAEEDEPSAVVGRVEVERQRSELDRARGYVDHELLVCPVSDH